MCRKCGLYRLGCRSAKPPPLIVVESSSEDVVAHGAPQFEILNDALPERSTGPFTPTTSAKLLTTKWYEYSDDAMRAAVSQLTASSQDAPPDHPCYAIMRVLSSAVHHLTRVRQELEESRRALLEKEAARKERAKQLLQELQPSDKDVAHRVFQSLFPDDDESTHHVHRVQRQQSLMVCVDTPSQQASYSRIFSLSQSH